MSSFQHTLGELLAETVALLAGGGVESARYDARILIAHVMDIPHTSIELHTDTPINREHIQTVGHLAALRAGRMPLQYVTRDTWFCGLHLRTDARAFIPRPETELLAEKAAEIINSYNSTIDDACLDICCGTGGIGLAVASSCPAVRIIGTDISPQTLQLAGENAALLGFGSRSTFLRGDYCSPAMQSPMAESIIFAVCNPPYVRPSESEYLEPEIFAEPHCALFSDTDDGLYSYRVIADQLQSFPRLRAAAFELGVDQAEPVAEIVSPIGKTEILKDYSGFERLVIVHVS